MEEGKGEGKRKYKMDFEKIVPLIIKEFEKEGIRYALMGGFAMGAFGVMRSTMDLDFLIDAADLEKVTAVMKKYSYNCVYSTDNISQYVAAAKIFGEIDFLHAFRKVSLSMFSRVKKITVLGGKISLNVLSPEDIIGLKLQALINDASRKAKEWADIESIAGHFGKKLDWRLIGDHFSLFKQTKQFKELKEKYGKA